jgi:Fe-S cluster assembly iron-binding protein IscA
MITVTEIAKKKFRETIEAEGRQGHGLRVSVNNAGTHQPEFALNFVAPGEVREDVQIDDVGEFKVYMDPQSAKHLEDAPTFVGLLGLLSPTLTFILFIYLIQDLVKLSSAK